MVRSENGSAVGAYVDVPASHLLLPLAFRARTHISFCSLFGRVHTWCFRMQPQWQRQQYSLLFDKAFKNYPIYPSRMRHKSRTWIIMHNGFNLFHIFCFSRFVDVAVAIMLYSTADSLPLGDITLCRTWFFATQSLSIYCALCVDVLAARISSKLIKFTTNQPTASRSATIASQPTNLFE